MITESPQELISLWEQILTGTYDATAAFSATAPTETTEVFAETLAEESQISGEDVAQQTAAAGGTQEAAASEGLTKSEILATGRTLMDATWVLWQSLEDNVQEQMRVQAQAVAQQAAQRAKAYWSQLTPEEQASTKIRAEQAAQHAVAYWQSLPA
uniref:Uncharacterized protein n=1 Tax=Desulfacinum infernum TaxID=35837 RepID=A0A832A561_9BACT